MSQATDYTVDNSTGANVRADINAIFDAIRTNNSGGSDNGSVGALGFFANTSSSKLQLKNAAGNAFINLRGFDGTLPLPDGSAASPSLFFDDDTDTGIFSGGANQFQITTGGAQRLKLDSTEIVFNDNGADTDFRIESDTQAHMFFLDAGNNRIGINQSTPISILHIKDLNPDFILENTTGNTGQLRVGHFGNGAFIGTYSDDGGASDLIRVGTHSGDERLRITSSGSIGIGGTAPNYQVHATTNIAVGAHGFAQQLLLGNNSVQSQVLGTGYSNLLLNALGGNIGAGTSSPATGFHYVGSELRVENSSDPLIRLKSTNAQGTNNDRYGRILSEGGGFTHGLLDWKRQGATDDAYFTLFTKQSVTDIQERIRITSKGCLYVHAGQQTNLNNMNKDDHSMPKFFENTQSQDNSLVGGVMHFKTIIRGTNASSDTLFTFEGGGNCGFFCEITAYFSSAVSDFQGRQRMWWRANRTGSGNFSLTQAHNYDKVGTATNVYFNPLWTSSGSGANQVLGVKVNSTNMGAYVRFWFVARIIAHDSINSMTINR